MTDRLRVLLVEDSPADAKLVLKELERTDRVIEHVRVETAEAMRAALDSAPWDIIVSDWSLPSFSAPAALAVVKERALDLPFIIVSGTVGEEHTVAAMRAGAHDYVLKGNLGRLSPAVLRETREHEGRQARRLAEAARGEAELRFSRLFDAGIIGVTIAETSGAIREANDTFLAMVGYTRRDLETGAINWKQMTPPEWREPHVAISEQLRVSGSVRPYEKEYLHKNGTRVPVLVGIARLDGGRTITVVTDLTDRKLAENANIALEGQLRHAQKMEAVGRLAGGIAHDFNNLLSVVISYSDLMLLDLKPDDPMRGDIGEIHRAGLRAEGLTRQLLTFSRKQVIAPKVLDLNELLRALDKMLSRLLGEDITMTFSAGEGLGRVRVDPGSIEQLIMNLAINARDAMPIGGKFTITTERTVLDELYVKHHLGATLGLHVRMTVTDTGCGMDADTLTHIFEPFFTTKELGRGTGLGLSTVFGIVQQSGGHITVLSAPGAGSTFTVCLPLVTDGVDPVPLERIQSDLHGTETILLVEDEAEVRGVAREILRRYGYTVLEAATPGDATLCAEQHPGPIHLLLSDVVMPNLSGPELAKRLTQVRPTMKLLFMSGYTDDATLRHGVIVDEVAFLQKPFTVQSLTRTVRTVLETPVTA